MPVEDHPVHPHGFRETYRAGCLHRGPPAAGYWAHDGWMVTALGQPYQARFAWVPFTMSTKCRQIVELPECSGCTAEKDAEYIQRMTSIK